MRGVFRVGRFPEEIWLVRRGADERPPAGAASVSGGHAAQRLEDWLPAGTLGRVTLAELAVIAGGAVLGSATLPEARLLGEVKQALRDGRLVAFAVKHDVNPAGKKKEEPPPGPAPGPAPEKKTWLEIVLLSDDEPPKPMALTKYKVELPDGSTREGQLDGKGMARFDGIDPGSAKVSFPGLHGPDWKKT